ncbi:MAG: putative dehydrogenase [Spirosomataceae bacterium]|jgi:predicted dehydrogenase
MKNQTLNRRAFIRNATLQAAGVGVISTLSGVAAPYIRKPVLPKIKFAAVGINHGHIYGMTKAVMRGGGELVSFYAKEDDLAVNYSKAFPQAKRMNSEKEILEDESIQLIISSAIPVERAKIAIRAMKHGKDAMVDKPGITTLELLKEVKEVQAKTNRIFSISYSERFENQATVKASELVKAGAIGDVIQTIGLGPHRINPTSRPDWFWEEESIGGIITDIASHQFDQFLHFTDSTSAEIAASQVGNINNKAYPNFQDFGDVMVRGNGGTGYIRVDWFTPDGLKSWGDGRLTILGTEGYIEIRKNIDIAGDPGGNHLFLVNNEKTQKINCQGVDLPYGPKLVNDILNRTETAMTQKHCFLAMELALIAQKNAVWV